MNSDSDNQSPQLKEENGVLALILLAILVFGVPLVAIILKLLGSSPEAQ